MKKNLTEIFKENGISSVDKYWAYPNHERNYKYSNKDTGIKIHLSATILNYETILNRFLIWNKKYKIGFKVAKSLKVLNNLNTGIYGYSQTGKFITLYPIQNIDYIEKILISLYKLYNDQCSVIIPSDVSFLRSNVVYVRYGAFRNNIGGFIDKRNGYIPNFIKNEFPVLDYSNYFVIPNFIKILEIIRKNSKGGIFIAWDNHLKKVVLLKEATKNGQMDYSGKDAVLSLYEESKILKKINSRNWDFVPNYIDNFWLENSLFLEEEYIEGKTIDEILRNNYSEIKGIQLHFKSLMLLIHKFHRLNNLVLHDLSTNNIIYSKGKFYIIDFEAVTGLDKNQLTIYGTKGFFDDNYKINDQTIDYYSIAKIFYFINYPQKYKNFVNKNKYEQNYDFNINPWLQRCFEHSYKNDISWISDFDKYVGKK